MGSITSDAGAGDPAGGAFVSRVGGGRGEASKLRSSRLGSGGIAGSYWQLEMKLVMGRTVGGRQGWVEKGWRAEEAGLCVRVCACARLSVSRRIGQPSSGRGY